MNTKVGISTSTSGEVWWDDEGMMNNGEFNNIFVNLLEYLRRSIQ